MNKLTKDQWAKIDEKLWGVFGREELQIDGYRIMLRVESVHRFKQAIVVYVNGEISGQLINSESEECRRFWCPKRRYVYSAKFRKTAQRLSKARREAFCPNHDIKITWHLPWWTSFRSLKAHLMKNNQSIELISEVQKHEQTIVS